MTGDEIIAALGLRPHPEGGHYGETWRGPETDDGRACATAIHFVLRAGERSHWHRVDAEEIWAWHHGAPLRLSIAESAGTVLDVVLGDDLRAGQRPHAVVPAGAWQAAASLGESTLVSCFVVPGFEFAGFELAPADWSP